MAMKWMIAYDRKPEYLPDDFDAAVGVELEGVVQFWWRYFFPRHFTARGAQIYRYEPRSQKYMQRKLRVKHHQDPLRWSDLTRAMAMGSITIQGPGAKYGRGGRRMMGAREARGLMNVPRYIFQNPRGKGMNKADEMTRLAPGEAGALSRVLQERTVYRLQLDKFAETMMIG